MVTTGKGWARPAAIQDRRRRPLTVSFSKRLDGNLPPERESCHSPKRLTTDVRAMAPKWMRRVSVANPTGERAARRQLYSVLPIHSAAAIAEPSKMTGSNSAPKNLII
ncbi:hypothetical protein [Sinorhizobium mexicanum]|uniref:hypothetical protein n=1 Tax=Sinorhizobium mexicanum TaxID=375549 RepID=UPI0015DE4092|nr:hypothetical protein [Sinorhizobium mexicanum]MBP1886214.1 hypothetical protein [Sinorhizobium mexicanum]